MNAYSEKPAPINWDYYNRNISKPNLVENFQKQFQALSVPYPKDTMTPLIEKHQKEFVSIAIAEHVPVVRIHTMSCCKTSVVLFVSFEL